MKDFALSLLSRGCGHVVRTQVDSQGGRIEVCFEPEDYFNWKSSQPLLRLSESGRIRCGAEPAPPKTYSTRKGPLLLYSADQALPRKPEDMSRKRGGCQHSVQEVQLQLRTLRDLTGAIWAYDKKQPQHDSNIVAAQPCAHLCPGASEVPPVIQLSQTWHPPASTCDPKKVSDGNDPPLVDCFPTPSDSGQIPCSEHSAQCQPTQCLSSTSVIYDHSKDQPVAPNPSPCDCEDETGLLFLHPRPYTVPQGRLPPIPECIIKNWVDSHLNSIEKPPQVGEVDDHDKTKNLCLRIVVDSPRVQVNPISETGNRDWGLNSRNGRDYEEGSVPYDVSCGPKYLGAHGSCSATEAGEVGERPCPLKTAFVDSSWSCSRLSRVTYYGGHLSGTRLGTNCVLDQKGGAAPESCSFTIPHLPPVPSGPLIKPIPSSQWSGPDKGVMKPEGLSALEKQVGTVHLPPVVDSNISTGSPILKPPRSPEDPHHHHPRRELHRKILLLPLLEHGQSQKTDMLRQHGGCHDTQAIDGMQDKENATTGCTNRGASPTPAIKPKNRRSSQTPAIEPRNRGSSPAPAIEPRNRGSSPTPAIEPRNRGSSPTPFVEAKNRVSSPTPAIQLKELNLDSLGMLESGKEDFASLGLLPPLGGRKGPGKQSSMALFRQDPTEPHDCCDPDNLQTAVVRGTLPVEMRDFQKGSAVGTLIMGPDGKIIQVSFWGSATDTNDQELLDDITRGRDMQVGLGMRELALDCKALNASEVIQGQPWTLLLQTDTGTLVSDSFGQQANINQSALNKQDGVVVELPHGQQEVEERYGLYLVCEEQCSLPKSPKEMGPISDIGHHIADQQSEEGMAGTWDLQSGPLGLGQKSSKESLPREEDHGTEPSASALSTESGNTTAAFLSNKQSANMTAGAMSGGKGLSGLELVETNSAGNAEEAQRNRVEQKEEADIRIREDTGGAQSFGKTLTEANSNPTLGKRKAKGLKATLQNVSGPQAREKHKGKQNAVFVVGNVQENASERLTEDRMSRPADVLKKLDGVISDGVVKDKDLGKQHGASSTTLGGIVNDGDSHGVKLNTSASQSNRVLGSGRLSTSDSACCVHTDTPATSRLKSRSSATSMMRGQSSTASLMMGQSPAGSMINRQSPAVSMTKSQSPDFSMMNLQSPTVSLTDGQLALKVARRGSSHENHINLDAGIDALRDGSRRGSVAHTEQQSGGRTARAEQRRMEVERKRADRVEQRKRQHEKEEREERIKQELQKEQEQRAEELRLRKLQELEEHQQQEQREKEHMRNEQAEREKERRRQEEKKRQMERFLKIRQEEEERRAAELERLRVKEEERLEEERRTLQGMEEDERQAYLLKCQKEEEQRRREAEERKWREGEAAITRQEAMLQLARQRAALEQRMKFRRALRKEAEALELAQSVSRPWVYSYYSLLKILGVQDLQTAPEYSASDTR